MKAAPMTAETRRALAGRQPAGTDYCRVNRHMRAEIDRLRQMIERRDAKWQARLDRNVGAAKRKQAKAEAQLGQYRKQVPGLVRLVKAAGSWFPMRIVRALWVAVRLVFLRRA